VDHVPDPLLLRKSGSTGNRTQTPGSVVRNSDQWTTEAVLVLIVIAVIVMEVVLVAAVVVVVVVVVVVGIG
jgi:hypothetical protein